ncbi:hypothetical protein FB451DRAFT_1033379, partial [Mycena latifolia]
MDIKFIGSGPAAKAILYYITDYITKSQLQAHVAYAALELAVTKLGDFDPTASDLETRARKLLQRCAHSLISKQELSAQQVVSYLMDFEDHFTSHNYVNLYWTTSRARSGSYTFLPGDGQCLVDFPATELQPMLISKYRLRLIPALVVDTAGEYDIMDGPGMNMPRVHFLDAHLESDTHVIKVRPYVKRKVPVLIGPAIPRRDVPASMARHARLMLILFKPWRHASDLRHADQSWVDAYSQFLRDECPASALECINNMQLLHECKDSRD